MMLTMHQDLAARQFVRNSLEQFDGLLSGRPTLRSGVG